MKKWMISILTVVLLMSSVNVSNAAAYKMPQFIRVILNGLTVDFPDAQPIKDDNNRTLVPLRFIVEKLGAKVDWDEETETVAITLGDTKIMLTAGENMANVNGIDVLLDTSAELKDDRLFVPLRFVTETFKATVTWNEAIATVSVITEGGLPADAKLDPYGRLIRTTNLPKNAADFPYILADYPNEWYEISFTERYLSKRAITAADAYKKYPTLQDKERVQAWWGRAERYFNLILNVDYRTITYQWAEDVLANETTFLNASVELSELKAYVDYVKANQIIVKGHAFLEPTVMVRDIPTSYFRTKVHFTIEHSKTNANIIKDVGFSKDKFVIGTTYEGHADISLGNIDSVTDLGDLRVGGLTSLFINGMSHYDVVNR